MSELAKILGGTGALLWAFGCVSSESAADLNPADLIDSTGVRFEWMCTEDKCALGAPTVGLTPPDCPEGRSPTYDLAWGRFFVIAAACANASGEVFSVANWERPVACDASSDCPQLSWFSNPVTFECRGGLCQNADTPDDNILRRNDARLLCYAPVDRADTNGLLVDPSVENLVDQACPEVASTSLCNLPLPEQCWQL